MPKLRTFRLHSNNLNCDCNLAWLSQWLRERPTIGLFTQCSSPAPLRGINVAEIQKHEFSCSGQSESAVGQSCSLATGSCPAVCTCSNNIVDCRGKGLTAIPANLPDSMAEIHMIYDRCIWTETEQTTGMCCLESLQSKEYPDPPTTPTEPKPAQSDQCRWSFTWLSGVPFILMPLKSVPPYVNSLIPSYIQALSPPLVPFSPKSPSPPLVLPSSKSFKLSLVKPSSMSSLPSPKSSLPSSMSSLPSPKSPPSQMIRLSLPLPPPLPKTAYSSLGLGLCSRQLRLVCGSLRYTSIL
ncbi:hypothetical protein PO909_019955 [Leuciscus waleckii]